MAVGAAAKIGKPAARYPRSARALPPPSSASALPAIWAWLARPFPAANRARFGDRDRAGFGHVYGADLKLDGILPGLRTGLRLLANLTGLAEVARVFQIVQQINGLVARRAAHHHAHGNLVLLQLRIDGDQVGLSWHQLFQVGKYLRPGK